MGRGHGSEARWTEGLKLRLVYLQANSCLGVAKSDLDFQPAIGRVRRSLGGSSLWSPKTPLGAASEAGAELVSRAQHMQLRTLMMASRTWRWQRCPFGPMVRRLPERVSFSRSGRCDWLHHCFGCCGAFAWLSLFLLFGFLSVASLIASFLCMTFVLPCTPV